MSTSSSPRRSSQSAFKAPTSAHLTAKARAQDADSATPLSGGQRPTVKTQGATTGSATQFPFMPSENPAAEDRFGIPPEPFPANDDNDNDNDNHNDDDSDVDGAAGDEEAEVGEEEGADQDDAIPYEEVPNAATAPDLLLPPPDFKPFFTLIEDRATGEHHHPTVHYLFADDDPELATSAALDSLASVHVHHGAGGGRVSGRTAAAAAEREERGEEEEAVEERCILVDLGADGRTVTGVASLSAGWQAVRTTVTRAPSWGDNDDTDDGGGGGGGDDGKSRIRDRIGKAETTTAADDEGEDDRVAERGGTEAKARRRGWMLRISGQPIVAKGGGGKDDKRRTTGPAARGGTGGGANVDMDEMIRVFDERLQDLDGVLNAHTIT